MSRENNQEHAFVIDALAHLIEHLAKTDEHDTGNQQVLLTLIAKELRYRTEQLIKE